MSAGVAWHDAFRCRERLLALGSRLTVLTALKYFSDANPISVKKDLRCSSQAWGQLEKHHESESHYDAGDLRRNNVLASAILSSYP